MSKTTEFELLKKESQPSDSKLMAFFDELPIVTVDEILSQKWKGGAFETGHWASKTMAEIKWFGKWYRTAFDALPMVCYNEEGKLFSNQQIARGTASLWMIEFRGKVSATMVYDGVPIFDHLKKVDDTTIMGVMNGKNLEGWPETVDHGKYFFFYLERIPEFPAEFIE